MSTSFDPRRGLIIISAEVMGPTGSAVLRLALDTGATATLINAALLVSIGGSSAATSLGLLRECAFECF